MPDFTAPDEYARLKETIAILRRNASEAGRLADLLTEIPPLDLQHAAVLRSNQRQWMQRVWELERTLPPSERGHAL